MDFLEPEVPVRLSVAFPAELTFFCRRFIWSSNKAGFYTRSSYTRTDPRSTPWRPYKRT